MVKALVIASVLVITSLSAGMFPTIRSARAEGATKVVLVDRVVARWTSSEHGLDQNPHAIYGRELAFEARLEAMTAGEAPDAPITERYVRAALNRHIAESLLAFLPIDPAPTPEVIGERATAAARVLEARVGGSDKIAIAARHEGISSSEIDAMHRRSARASLYLDRMVLPELEPTKIELVELYGSGTTPYSKEPFENVESDLKRWAMAKRLNDALDTFYQRSRSRVTLTFAKDWTFASDASHLVKLPHVPVKPSVLPARPTPATPAAPSAQPGASSAPRSNAPRAKPAPATSSPARQPPPPPP